MIESSSTINWSAIAPPISFETEETVSAFADEIINMHQSIIEDYVCFNPALIQSQWDTTIGQIESVVQTYFCTYYGQTTTERYLDIFEQVSYFVLRLAKDHIFNDGNKRTALLALLYLIEMRPVKMNIDDEPNPERNILYKKIEAAVSGKLSEDEFASILRQLALPEV